MKREDCIHERRFTILSGSKTSTYSGKTHCSDCKGQWKFHRETKMWVPVYRENKNESLIYLMWVFIGLSLMIFINSCSCPQWNKSGCTYEDTALGEIGKWLSQIL